MAQLSTTGLSWDQLDIEFPNLDYRELHDGVLHVTPSPAWWHQLAAGRLYRPLSEWADASGAEVFGAAIDVVAAPDRVYQPDVLLLLAEHRNRLRPNGKLHGAPDLVAEILSPSTRRYDQGPKRAAYETLGVAEHWLVDLDAATLALSRLEEGRYPEHPVVLTPSDTLTSPLLPGFALLLERVLASTR